MNSTEQDNLIQLRHNLNTYFDKGEIRSLCFDLGIDYENLPEAKEAAIRELIRFAIRYQRLDTLIEQCRELRAHVTWPDFSPEVAAALTRTPIPPTQLSKGEQKERQKQLILLDKVKNFWVKGVLESLVPDDKLLALGRHVSTEMIDHPWHDVVDAAVYDAHTLDTYKNILEIFIESNHALLILGEPGAGKTTTLLELARELITLTEQDPAQPIPVVLNLSSWAARRTSIADWAVEELSNKYQIPQKTSRPWLENDNLLLLLDGLDEVPDKHRAACVNTINEFRAEHGLTGLVVSSRSYEYEGIGTKLKLDGAVLLQSLTSTQIDSYLATFGSRLSVLREAIQQDTILKEMAQSPLMLKVMSVAYENIDEVNIDSGDDLPTNLATSPSQPDKTVAIYHQQLFETYVRRMLHRQDNPTYTPAQTEKWLTWLAQRMTHHNQTIFLIEQMQPSWFASRRWRWVYLIVARLTAGFIAGLFMWLMYLMGNQVNPEISSMTIEQLGKILQLPSAYADFLSILLLMMSLGLVVAGIDGFHFERNSDYQRSSNNKRDWQRTAIVGSTVTLIAFFFTQLFDPLVITVFLGLTAGLVFTFNSVFIDGASFNDDIKTTEALGWSWSNSLKGIIVGFVPGMILGWLSTQIFDSGIDWLYYAYLPSLIITSMLLGGLQKNNLDTKTQPNQGIRLSARNAILTVPLFSIPVGLIFGFRFDPSAGLIMGVLLGMMAGAVYGGGHVLKHFGLRLVFWYKGYVPLNYIPFLNHAARHVLLHKVGGGYVFVHRLLQEYFANLDVIDSDK